MIFVTLFLKAPQGVKNRWNRIPLCFLRNSASYHGKDTLLPERKDLIAKICNDYAMDTNAVK